MGRKNERIKKAHTVTEYTADQLDEIAKCADDPIYFCRNYIKVQHPTKGAIPLVLYDYQEEMIRMMRENRFNIMLSARQTGKAGCLSTEIATPTGFVTMGDVKVGDVVLGGDGKPTNVVWVSDVDPDPVSYRVHFSTGEHVDVCKDHQWLVNYERHRTSSTYVRVVTTQDMVDSGVTKTNARGYEEAFYSVNLADPIELLEAELPIDPYVLGVWLGDGASRDQSVTSLKTDTELHQQLVSRCGEENVIFGDHSSNPNVYSIRIQGLMRKLKQVGIFGNKRIPREYMRASYEQRMDVVRGLMDTDGFSGGGGSNCEISLSNEDLSNDVFELLCTVGIKPTRMVIKTKAKDSHRINFTAYSDRHRLFYLTRKQDTMKKSPAASRIASTLKRMVTKIESIDPKPMKCIMVDNKDHTYLVTRSLIKTHNSTVSAMYLLWFAMFNEDKTILIASNKNKGAMEMISRIRFAYEELPLWLKPGVMDDMWNKHAVGFDNGSRIESTATTESSGRGMSISCVAGNTPITVRNKKTGLVEEITIAELAERLDEDPIMIVGFSNQILTNEDESMVENERDVPRSNYELDDGPLTSEQYAAIREASKVSDLPPERITRSLFSD